MIQEFKKGVRTRLSDNFNSVEFHCHCRYPECRITYIDSDLVDYLERKRALLNKPIYISSGFRCVRYNRKENGKAGSLHLVGKAADIFLKGEDIIKKSSLFQDADGLGIYFSNHFLHVDVRGYKARWIVK